jgi:hypothetical protein
MSNNVKEIVQDYLSGQWRSSCGCTARTVITRTSASNEDFAFACIKLALFHYSFIKSDESILNYAAVDLEHNVHLRSQVQQMVRNTVTVCLLLAYTHCWIILADNCFQCL